MDSRQNLSFDRVQTDGGWIPRSQLEACTKERSFWQLVELVVFYMEESKCQIKKLSPEVGKDVDTGMFLPMTGDMHASS